MQSAPTSATPVPTPQDKLALAACITEAVTLEQEFMCQYLYAAFSLKKYADSTCSPAQLESVRRWASTTYTIARQEMEHLSIANSLLTAIGYSPWFGHNNFPSQSRWYKGGALKHKMLAGEGPDGGHEPCDFPFLLQAFDLQVARRFCCMESPLLDYVPKQDQKNLIQWCYESDDGGCASVPGLKDVPESRLKFLGGPNLLDSGVEPGTVQELYKAIEQGFKDLDAELGSKALFSGHPSGQSQITNEYDIYVFPICDLASALAGIHLITRQGEGIDAPPGYDSHYQNFYDMAVEYEGLLAKDPSFEPALPLPLNPDIEQYEKGSVTRDAVRAFNDGYVELLYMLTGYYGNYTTKGFGQKPYLFQALEQTMFASTMTMLVRSLGELITQLPADSSGAPAGPTFFLSEEVLGLLKKPADPIFLDINFHATNLSNVADLLGAIVGNKSLPEALKPKFLYVQQNVLRIVGNLQYIYQNGTYPAFLNLPNCPQDDDCG